RILGEHVQAERARPRVDERDRLLDAVDLEDRENRAEDLLLHRGRIRRYVHEHGWRDESILPIAPAAVIDRPAREQRAEPIEVTQRDDAAVVRTRPRILAVEIEQGFLQ